MKKAAFPFLFVNTMLALGVDVILLQTIYHSFALEECWESMSTC